MKAHELIADESKWTRCVAARSADGSSCDAIASFAVCWCAIGAIFKCYPDDPEQRQALDRVHAAALKAGYPSGGDWNDAVGHAEVVRVLKELDI